MRLPVPFAATIAAILLTSQAASAGTLIPKVLVMPAPLKPYVDEILRGLGTSVSLLNEGQDPHDFSLTPSQSKAIEEADIVIVPDIAINPLLKKLTARKKLVVIELSTLQGAEPLPYAEENPWLATVKKSLGDKVSKAKSNQPERYQAETPEKDDTEKKPVVDPHLWLDPERMAAMAEPLANRIADQAPESRALLTSNARTLANHLRHELLPQLQTMLHKDVRLTNAMSQPEIPFITYHAAYQYFLARFNLTHYGEITQRPEEVFGGKSMLNLLNQSEKIRVRCIIGEHDNSLLSRVATLTGAKIILMSPEQLPGRSQGDALDWLKNDYDRLLYQTAKAFAGCL